MNCVRLMEWWVVPLSSMVGTTFSQMPKLQERRKGEHAKNWVRYLGRMQFSTRRQLLLI